MYYFPDSLVAIPGNESTTTVLEKRLQVSGFSIRDLLPVAFPHLRFALS